MTLGGLLVFADSPAGAAGARRRFGGLTNLERGVRTMARAGVRRLLVVVPEGVEVRFGSVTDRLDLDLEVVYWGREPQRPFADDDMVLVLLGDHVHHHASLSAFVGAGGGDADVTVQVSPAPAQSLPLLCAAGGGRALLQAEERGADDLRDAAARVLTGAVLCSGRLQPHALVASRTSPLAYLASRATDGRVTAREGDAGLWRRVTDRPTARQAKAMLFSQVTKKTSGPVSRHINARLSIPISKVLIETGISPHMVTVLFVLTTGLAAAWLLADPRPYWRLALAGCFWQLAAILDRCDGEIARVKLCESKFGAWFDTLTDNIAYLATYAAFLVGIRKLHPDQPWLLYLGVSAVGAMLLALAVMYNYALKTGSGSLQNYLVGFRAHVPAHEKNFVYRVLERYAFIAKRDFFAFVHFLCCIVGSFELLYLFTVGGLHLVVVGVLISQRKMLDGYRRRLAPAPGAPALDMATGAVPAAAARPEASPR